MKKIFKQSIYPIILLALLASCEPAVEYVTETKTEYVYVETDPEDQTVPANAHVIGQWSGPTIYWDLNSDYTYSAFHPDMSPYFSGTYRIVQGVKADAGKEGLEVTENGTTFVVYWFVILENTPAYGQRTLRIMLQDYDVDYLMVGE